MKTLFITILVYIDLLVCDLNGATEGLATILSGRPIHPKVFNMIICFISDTESPVVTAVNLNAVLKNRNQFDYEKVHTDGERVVFNDPDGIGVLNYKLVSRKNDSFRIVYRENGGGSLTTLRYITFRIESRKIVVNGESVAIKNLIVSDVGVKADYNEAESKK